MCCNVTDCNTLQRFTKKTGWEGHLRDPLPDRLPVGAAFGPKAKVMQPLCHIALNQNPGTVIYALAATSVMPL